MIDPTSLYLFIVANVLLALAPGPDNIYVLTQGITRGKKAAFITTLGFTSGVVIHTSAAAFGISVIFQTSQLAFDIVKYIGALYLIYLAYQAFKYRNEPLNLSSTSSNREFKKLYLKAFFMNILNPKVSIFFLAFLPQFVDPSLGNIQTQMIILGIVFMLVTVVVFGSIGYMGNILSVRLRENKKIVTYMNTLTSFVLLSLGLKLLFTQR
ncbi:LysE family translocator [Arcobacteraceae bacterium]|nr:LysE family translocator [Arcobacteraceae bacterium]